jgi:hypothetical protein
MTDETEYWTFLTVGTLMLVGGMASYRRARASVHWPALTAEILDSSIKERRGRRGPHFRPAVIYAYRVEGAYFQGDRITFAPGGVSSGSRGAVERMLEVLPKGGHIPVRVCPVNPRLSVIQPGVARETRLMSFAGAYFIFIALGGFLGWWH